MDEDEAARQIKNEMEFGGRVQKLSELSEMPAVSGARAAGVLPVHIRVPTSGQVYRFARTIIQPSDPLSFSVAYTRLWVISLIKWLLVALAALIVYWNRRRLIWALRFVSAGIKRIAGWIRSHERVIGQYSRSVATPFVLIGLALVFSGVSDKLGILFLVLFVVSLSYHLARYIKKYQQTSPASKESADDTGATP
jgi:hypothetical protein